MIDGPQYKTRRRFQSNLKRFWSGYRVLLWKNYLLRRRTFSLVIVEFLFPLLFVYALIYIKGHGESSWEPACHIQSQSLPSMGLLNYLQSMACNFNYTCLSTDPEAYQTLNGISPLIYLIHNITELLKDPNFKDWTLNKSTMPKDPLVQFMRLSPKLLDVNTAIMDFLTWSQANFATLQSGDAVDIMRNLTDLLCGSKQGQNDVGRLLSHLGKITADMENEIALENQMLSQFPVFNKSRRFPRSSSSGGGKRSDHICKKLKQFLVYQPFIQTLGRLRFFLFGQVPYFPANQLTNQIVSRASGYIDRQLGKLHNFVKYVSQVTIPWLEVYSRTNNSIPDGVSSLQKYLADCSSMKLLFIPKVIRENCKLLSDLLNTHISASKDQLLHQGQSPPGGTLKRVKAIMEIIDDLFTDCFSFNDRYIPFNSEEKFHQYLTQHKLDLVKSPIGVIFETIASGQRGDGDDNFSLLSITFRKDSSLIDHTLNYQAFDRYTVPVPRRDPAKHMNYFSSGFIDLQDQLSRAVVALHLDKYSTRLTSTLLDIGIEMKSFPNPPYIYDIFLNKLVYILPQLMVLLWSLSVILTVKYMVYEKEQNVDQFLAIFGLSRSINYLAWLTVSFIIMSTISILLVYLLRYGGLLPRSSLTLVYFFLINYIISCLVYCTLFITLTERANLAAIGAGVCYFVLYLPAVIILRFENVLSDQFLMLLCLLPQVSHCLGWSLINYLEVRGTGAQWSDLLFTGDSGSAISIGVTILLLWVTIGLYCLITLTGLPLLRKMSQHITQFYTRCILFNRSRFPSHKLTRKHKRKQSFLNQEFNSLLIPNDNINIIANDNTNPSDKAYAIRFQSMEDYHLVPTVTVDHLTKSYSTQGRLALDDVSMNFYENQITVIMGHNGAGKTTLLSILIGQLNPTYGKATIHGYEVKEFQKLSNIQLGYCPQYNILYDNLTVSEHFYLFGLLRGMGQDELVVNMNSYLNKLNMKSKEHEFVKTLSGGQKRKLCLFLSFIGSSKVIMLDEPTASLDPFSRRSVWDLLKSMRKNRTLILTSHHMHESEILADYLIIVSQGKLICSGTSLSLKSAYGSGYRLSLERVAPSNKVQNSNPLESETILQIVQKHVSNARVLYSSSSKILISLPIEKAFTGDFVPLLQELESPEFLTTNNVTHFELSDSTLEEVFFSSTDQHFAASTFNMSAKSNTITKTVANVKLTSEEGTGNTTASRPTMLANPSYIRKHNSILTITDNDASSNTSGSIISSVSHGNNSNNNANLINPNMDASVDEECAYSSMSLSSVDDSSNNFTYTYDYVPFSQMQLIDDRNVFTDCNDNHDDDDADDDDEDDDDDVTAYGDDLLEQRIFCRSSSRASNYKLFNSRKRGKFTRINRSLNSSTWSSHIHIIIAMLLKRYYHMRRRKLSWFIEFIFPSIIVLISLILLVTFQPTSIQPSMDINPWLMMTPHVDYLQSFYHQESRLPANDRQIEFYQNAFHQLESLTSTGCIDSASYKPEPRINTICREKNGNQLTSEKCSNLVQEMKLTDSIKCYELMTGDVLFNLTGLQVSEYLLKEHIQSQSRLFGGFELKSTRDYGVNQMLSDSLQYMINQMSSASGQSAQWKQILHDIPQLLPGRNFLRVWYNNRGYASSVAYLNVLHNLQLRLTDTYPLDPRKSGIIVKTHPLDSTSLPWHSIFFENLKADSIMSLVVVLALSIIPSSFIVLLVVEGNNNSRHLQQLSGLSSFFYWLTNFMWDAFIYVISGSICVLLLTCFGRTTFTSGDVIFPFTLVVYLYGGAMIAFIYAFSFLFKQSSTAFVYVCGISIFVGTVTTTTSFFMELISLDNGTFKASTERIQNVFRMTPHYCLGSSIHILAMRNFYQDLGLVYKANITVWNALSTDISCLLLQTVCFIALIVLIECNCLLYYLKAVIKACVRFTRNSSSRIFKTRQFYQKLPFFNESSDNFIHTPYAIRVDSVVKHYWTQKHPTVNRISFAIRPGECFGLLGSNGAGKSTTYSMLTGLCSITKGKVFINGHNLAHKSSDIYRSIGYCPQDDALHDSLTVQETLFMYSYLRRIKPKLVNSLVGQMILLTGLQKYANCVVQKLSGGNKRKLSTAIAFIGQPKIVLLDEPSNGMDPSAKRLLWLNVRRLLKAKSAVLLSSHCMEECELLCTRVGLLANGELKCVGTPMELKSRFGLGYHLELEFTPKVMNYSFNQLQARLAHFFPGFELRLPLMSRQEYSYGKQKPLWYLFKIIQELNQDNILNYLSLRQCSLEDVFVNFISLLEKDNFITDPSTTTICTDQPGRRSIASL